MLETPCPESARLARIVERASVPPATAVVPIRRPDVQTGLSRPVLALWLKRVSAAC